MNAKRTLHRWNYLGTYTLDFDKKKKVFVIFSVTTVLLLLLPEATNIVFAEQYLDDVGKHYQETIHYAYFCTEARTQTHTHNTHSESKCGCAGVSDQGAVSIRKTVLPGMAIPMLKIRRPNGRLIFNMEIAIRR